MFNVCTSYDISNQKYDSTQRTYTFIAKASHGVVVAINADEYEEGQLEEEIVYIEEYHKKWYAANCGNI